MKLGAVILLLFSLSTAGLGSLQDSMSFGPFGTVAIYRESEQPANVVLFISGDGGWNLGVIDMAKSLASLDALVVGIDIVRYLRELENSTEKCSYPAGDFELLSKFVQQKYGYSNYVTPILVGYSSGATLVYAALVQAPPNTFKGAMSLGFCPDLPLTKPFCRGEGLEWKAGPKGKGYSFLPAGHLEVPWIALQGIVDQVCSPDQTEKFVRQVKNGELIQLPKVGHGFSVQKNWMPQFKRAFLRLASTKPVTPPEVSDPNLANLPISIFPASNQKRDWMAMFITGDGGWGVTDKGITQALADSGISVVGLNSLKYFWKRRTPSETAQDLEKILTHYLALWKKEKVLLIGYSLGADVLPFMVNGLSPELRQKIGLITLLGPGHSVDFKFHLTNWLGGSQGKNALPVRPEVEKLRGIRILCFYGENDKDALCPELKPGLVESVVLEGGHRVKHNYGPILEEIMKMVK